MKTHIIPPLQRPIVNTLFNCFKNKNIFTDISNIWENTDGCEDKYS